MKVTVCEIIAEDSQLQSQWQALLQHVEETNSDLLLLPEMPFSPWLSSQKSVSDEEWSQSISSHMQWLEKVKDIRCPVILSMPVTANDQRLNRAMVANQGKELFIHDKYYLPNEDGFWEADCYQRGNGDFMPINIGSAFVGVQICSEIWFMEHSRRYGHQGVQIIVNPRANYPEDRKIWKTATVASAFSSGTYVLTSNLLPENLGKGKGAGAWVINPDGETIAETGDGQYFVTVEIDIAASDQAKHRYPCYIDA